MIKITPAHITALGPDDIFVFGSNARGAHGAGAAKLAYEKFGAVWGVGEGPCGQTYAIPTKDKYLKTLPVKKIAASVMKFIQYAKSREDKTFWVTAIGCGLAGYKPARIAPLFWCLEIPDNVVLPQEFHSARWPRIRNLPVKERAALELWLSGQTRPMIEGEPIADQDAFYPWDYERWKHGLPVID